MERTPIWSKREIWRDYCEDRASFIDDRLFDMQTEDVEQIPMILFEAVRDALDALGLQIDAILEKRKGNDNA